MQSFNTPVWNRRIKVAFWIIGITFGSVMAYTTRYFINGDALVYVEMGECLRTARWIGLANLTYSPGYSLLLGVGQILLNTNPLNELQLLRIVNVFSFLLAMGACELVLHFVKKEVNTGNSDNESALPYSLISALCYSMFLVATLVFIRIRLLNPDMLVFAIVLTCVAVILWIRENPLGYFRYVLLGLIVGVGYVAKSFFLPFSPVLFALAGMCSGSLKKAVPRVVVALLVMLIVSAPLIGVLSKRLGRFTYGELGKHVYAVLISGKGTPKYPEVLNSSPKVTRYLFDVECTRPSGYDICYWHEGFRPDFNLKAHAKIIPGTMVQIITQTPWLLLIVVWYVALWRMGSARFGPLNPPSVFFLIMLPAIAGIGFYCLIRMEPRYIAGFLFLGFVALTVSLRSSTSDLKTGRWAAILSGLLIAYFLAIVTHSLVDQSIRGLYSTDKKPSYRASFEEHIALKSFLLDKGLKKGDYAALVGSPPVYWGRMAGLRIVAEADNAGEFLKSSIQARSKAVQAFKESEIRVVVAKGSEFRQLASEGWIRVPGTRDFFVLLLPVESDKHESISMKDKG